MQITDYLVSHAKTSPNKRILVAVTGRAGAGKTTLTQRLAGELAHCGVPSVVYSGDWRFILDSAARRTWLHETWRVGLDAYLDAVNQMNWWDFRAIATDLSMLQAGEMVAIPNAYDRATGQLTSEVTIGPLQRGIILFENAILGALERIPDFDSIVLVNTPDVECLTRLLRKDGPRRSAPGVAARFLMTSYSENTQLRALYANFSDRLVACDADGAFGPFPSVSEVTHIPVPVHWRGPQPTKRGTVFCDLDGTLVRHVPVPSPTGDDIELLEGSVEKLKELRQKGFAVVLTTSRGQSNMIAVMERLRALGLEFDQVVCDLPLGPRHLINDSKEAEVRAFAHPLTRNAGIGGIDIR